MMTNQPRPSRSRLAALPLAGISAVLLIGLVAIAIVRLGEQPVVAVGADPSPSPIASAAAAPAASSSAQASLQPLAVQSPLPSPSPIASAAAAEPAASPAAPMTPSCRARDLSARILAWDGAAGSRIAAVEVQNKAAVACTVGEPTAIHLIAADGTVLIDSSKVSGLPTATPGGSAITVPAGGSIETDVRVANYCGDVPNGPIGVSLSLPEPGGTVVAMPGSGVSSADAIPPCNGPIGPDIEMNGWR
jgi:hypothetical protein